MTPVTSNGSISISSCLNCEKVFSLAEQLSKSMQEFEILTMEIQFDPKSAKLKSQVLSNFWQLISKIESLKMSKPDQVLVNEKELSKNQDLDPGQSSSKSSLDHSVEKHQIESEDEETKNPNEPVKSKSQSKSQAAASIIKMKSRQQPKRNQNLKSNPNPSPNPYMTPKRLIELKRAKGLLRTIKCETGAGFYNLFECTKCRRQFTTERSGLRHVQNIHLKLGTPCPTCRSRFFNKSYLDLHIPKCQKREQFKKITVWIKNDNRKPVKVQLQPRQKQAPSTRNRNQNGNSVKMTQDKRQPKSKTFDPLKIKVNNPFKNFSLEKTLNVKVLLERLRMKKSGKISRISQTSAIEEIESKPEEKKQRGQMKSAKTENKRRAWFL